MLCCQPCDARRSVQKDMRQGREPVEPVSPMRPMLSSMLQSKSSYPCPIAKPGSTAPIVRLRQLDLWAWDGGGGRTGRHVELHCSKPKSCIRIERKCHLVSYKKKLSFSRRAYTTRTCRETCPATLTYSLTTCARPVRNEVLDPHTVQQPRQRSRIVHTSSSNPLSIFAYRGLDELSSTVADLRVCRPFEKLVVPFGTRAEKVFGSAFEDSLDRTCSRAFRRAFGRSCGFSKLPRAGACASVVSEPCSMV